MLALTLAALLVIAFVAAQPASAQYQPGQPGFILDPPIVAPGQTVDVIGNGCPRGSTVEIYLDGVLADTVTAADDDTGAFAGSFPAPPVEGTYMVEVRCGDVVMSQVLTVAASACGFIPQGVAGGQATVLAPGFQIGTPYQLTFFSQPQNAGSGVIESDPHTVVFQIPSNAAPGEHTLRVSGTSVNGQPKVLDCPTVVLGGGTLPRTGSDPSGVVFAGVSLLVAGGFVLLAGRHRRRRTA
jgi:LPXTG-motif cell wall-anchored protein